GQRTVLAQRSIDRFKGFNETRSKEILDMIAIGLESGKTTEQIAATIRADYGETYKNQSFTIAKNELLNAISQGMKWNDDILKQIFSKTGKQWFHVAPSKDSRDNHIGFESDGDKGVVP